MQLRAVVSLLRTSERVMSRLTEPRGLGFRVQLLRRVVRALDEREGQRISHVGSACLASVLASLGVTGVGPVPEHRHALAAGAASGVLHTLHVPSRGTPAARRTRGQVPGRPGSGTPTGATGAEPRGWQRGSARSGERT